jgi:hypothetical protein
VTIRWRGWLPCLLALLACAAPARATVGGPTRLEVLGWDPATHRVYVHSVAESGGDGFGDVLYFALDARDPQEAVSTDLAGRGEGSARDSTLVRRLAALRRRLSPLPGSAPGFSLPYRETVKTDTLRDRVEGPIARHQVLARWAVTPGEFEFTTYDRPDVVLRSVHAVPGRAERLLVFAFIGDPFEGGYETQVAVLVTSPADVKREVR